MTRRTVILVVVLLGVVLFAVRRRSPAPTDEARRRDAEAEAAARRFLALRDAEDRADRTTWKATEPVVRIEQELIRGVERALAANALDSGPLPGLSERISPPSGLSLRWLQMRLMRAVPSPGPEASTGGLRAEVETEVVLVAPATGARPGETWTARFRVESDWADGDPPRLLDYRLSGPPVVLRGSPVFETWAELVIPTNGVGLFADPLLLEPAVDGVRLHLVGAGVAAVRAGEGWRWERADTGLPDRVSAAVRADLDGDGVAEWAIADTSGLRIQGRGGGRVAWPAPARLRHPQSICAGDIDGDGDLDLWLTQYRLPFVNGQFPTPYYDANDGFPAYLLRNDGDRWSDVTEASGLAPKRHRRAYSASWLDFDGDGDLDLIQVSDFAGIDLFRNDGQGRFTDLTPDLGQHRHAFGMAHAVWDANRDALPDVFMVGMDSPVASQLDALGLGRPEFPGHASHRAPMTYGNRLFTGSSTRGLEFSPTSEGLRRAGWAWGAAVLDWNNDGLEDLHLVNGHETFGNRADFERQFWQHDIHVGSSTPDPATRLYFEQANARRRAGNLSYGGWQANRLFTQTTPGSFVENAWVAGVAVTEDCRNVVAGDFDGDGRMDLALTTYEQWPEMRQRLVLLRNRHRGGGHWIGYRLDVPAPGSRVEVTTRAGVRRHWWVQGDGYRSQSDLQAHFGLGPDAAVVRAEWVRPDGTRVALPVEPDRWHRIPAASR